MSEGKKYQAWFSVVQAEAGFNVTVFLSDGHSSVTNDLGNRISERK